MKTKTNSFIQCTLLLLFFGLSTSSILAQPPLAIPFQAAARDSAGTPITNQFISLRFGIYPVPVGGILLYQETQTVTTNPFGLFNANVGQGTVTSGSFSGIDWSNGDKYIQVEMDAAGGNNYVDMGRTQLLSVPYAFFSASSADNNWQTTGADIHSNNTGNVGIGNSTPVSKFSVGTSSQFQVNSNGAIVAATGISSAGSIQFTGLGSNGIVRTSGGNGTLSSSGGTVNLATEVGGILGIANGGTGSASQNFVDLTSNQSVGGLKTFTKTPVGTTVGSGSVYINPSTNGGSASNVVMGLAVAGVEKLSVDASGNLKAASLTGVGNRMVQANTNGLLVQLPAGTASQVLLGTGAWGSVPTNTSWSLTGNSGTLSGTNFLGTTDSQPLLFKVNNQKSGLVDHINLSTAFGYQALNANPGSENSAFGYLALSSITTGISNTAVGSNALPVNSSGVNNSGFGNYALRLNTSGSNNVAVGTFALYSNTTSQANTAIGSFALYLNSGGANNTATGFNALTLNTDGFSNVANGTNALNSNNTGNHNSALGFSSLSSNLIGSYNTAEGSTALIGNTTGSYNTALGSNSLSNNVTGNLNTAVGYNAGVLAANGNLTNVTAIGANAIVSTSNSVVIGNNANVGIGTSAPNSRLELNGSFATRIIQSSGTGNVTLDNNISIFYIVTNVGTTFFPAASVCPYRRYIIVNRSGSTRNTDSFTDLSGANASTIATNASVEIVSDGTNWLQIK